MYSPAGTDRTATFARPEFTRPRLGVDDLCALTHIGMGVCDRALHRLGIERSVLTRHRVGVAMESLDRVVRLWWIGVARISCGVWYGVLGAVGAGSWLLSARAWRAA